MAEKIKVYIKRVAPDSIRYRWSGDAHTCCILARKDQKQFTMAELWNALSAGVISRTEFGTIRRFDQSDATVEDIQALRELAERFGMELVEGEKPTQ